MNTSDLFVAAVQWTGAHFVIKDQKIVGLDFPVSEIEIYLDRIRDPILLNLPKYVWPDDTPEKLASLRAQNNNFEFQYNSNGDAINVNKFVENKDFGYSLFFAHDLKWLLRNDKKITFTVDEIQFDYGKRIETIDLSASLKTSTLRAEVGRERAKPLKIKSSDEKIKGYKPKAVEEVHPAGYPTFLHGIPCPRAWQNNNGQGTSIFSFPGLYGLFVWRDLFVANHGQIHLSNKEIIEKFYTPIYSFFIRPCEDRKEYLKRKKEEEEE